MARSNRDQCWLNKQRRLFRNGGLTPKQISKIEQIPGWEWEPNNFGKYYAIADELMKTRVSLPCPQHLRLMGYRKLAEKIKNYPEMFSQYPQESFKKGVLSDEKAVAIAKKFEKRNGGWLNVGLLQKSGNAPVYERIRSKPHLFSDINFVSLQKKLESHVLDAEREANENGGELPLKATLKRAGKSGLVKCMRGNPEAFAHIPQGKRGLTLKEAVEKIRLLVVEKGGIPGFTWLNNNGYKDCTGWLQRRKDAFSEHKRLDAHTPIETHLETARKLVKRFGRIPKPIWLTSNGHSKLYTSMRQYPDRYLQFLKARTHKTKEEYTAEIIKLNKEMGGVPNSRWLQLNGKAGLYKFIKKNPKVVAKYKRLNIPTKPNEKS